MHFANTSKVFKNLGVPIMDFKMRIQILLFAFYYSVLLLSNVSCYGTPSTNSDQINNNSTSASANISLIPESERESNVSENNTGPVSLEGGSTAVVNPHKTVTVRTSAEEKDLTLSNEKRPNLLASDLYSPAIGTSSSHNHVSKGRKGVNAADLESSPPADIVSEHSSSIAPTVKIEQTTLKNGNNTVNGTSKSVGVTVAPKNVSINSHSSTMSPLNVTSKIHKILELTNKTGSNDTKSDENKENIQNSTPIFATMVLSTPKLKPEFTRVDSSSDDQSSFAFTSESDYVIPVVAIVFAVPLFVILGMVLYKRSREFWERRHYRRMDFLIDGMYND